MTIEPKISKYIDTTVDRAVERHFKVLEKNIKTHIDEVGAENRRHMGALKEAFQDETKIIAELVEERPKADEAREIAREEAESSLRPINAKLDFLNEERHAMMDALADIKA